MFSPSPFSPSPGPVSVSVEAPLSIVIPARDAGGFLPATLAAVAEGRGCGLVREIIVVDGGSRDDTAALAREFGARLIAAPAGRGTQLAAGGEAASGAWLLFLHADTILPPGWPAAVAGFLGATGNAARAGYFALRFDDEGWAPRLVERGVAWRCRWLGLPYGDQGLLIAAASYRALGGFRPLPLMEDVDLVRRIGGRRLTLLPEAVTTSASRYRRDGYGRRILRNLACLALYYLGVPPRLILRLYA